VRRASFIAGTATVLIPHAVGAETLYSAVERAASGASGEVGVYARRLGRSASDVEYNADTIFPAASTIKVLILVSLYQLGDNEPSIFERELKLTSLDQVSGSDALQNANPGDMFSVRSLAHAMITVSDNTASNMLISLLGFERLNATARNAGLTHMQCKHRFVDASVTIKHSVNLTSPHDMGVLLYEIERGSREGVSTVASPPSCRKMIKTLLEQQDRDKIARGLPKGVPLANKTGEVDGVRNDAAIVDPFGDGPYVLTIYTKNLNDFSEGNAAIRRIAKAVHGSIGNAPV
jgi:beta-lactamase class A